MKKLRLVLADDHAMFRQGIRALIDGQPDLEVVGEASDGQAALDELAKLAPDLLVMDISMPRMGGLQVMQELRKRGERTRVLALTAFSDSAYLRELLSAGVAGYLLKQAAAEDLIKAIHVVATGGTYLDPAIAGKVASGFIEHKKLRGARAGGELSEREQEVLRDVAQGYTNKEIAGRLRISVKTVETHKANVAEKLGLNTRAELVRYALARGWLRDE